MGTETKAISQDTLEIEQLHQEIKEINKLHEVEVRKLTDEIKRLEKIENQAQVAMLILSKSYPEGSTPPSLANMAHQHRESMLMMHEEIEKLTKKLKASKKGKK